MRNGARNRRVTIERRGSGKDMTGQAEDVWLPVCTTWAEIQPQAGMRQPQAEAEVAVAEVKIEIRYRADVVAGMRVRYGRRLLEINAALDVDTRHEALQLLCLEGLDQGV